MNLPQLGLSPHLVLLKHMQTELETKNSFNTAFCKMTTSWHCIINLQNSLC